MAEEDEIKELIGRMSAAQRQGFHVTPGALRIVLAALRFYLAARSWLAKPHADPHDDAPRNRSEPYTGPLPTIGDSRRLGLEACIVTCAAPDCWHEARVTFDNLALPDDTIFVHIPQVRRFKCGKCGSRKVEVSADWRDHVAAGKGRPASDPSQSRG